MRSLSYGISSHNTSSSFIFIPFCLREKNAMGERPTSKIKGIAIGSTFMFPMETKVILEATSTLTTLVVVKTIDESYIAKNFMDFLLSEGNSTFALKSNYNNDFLSTTLWWSSTIMVGPS